MLKRITRKRLIRQRREPLGGEIVEVRKALKHREITRNTVADLVKESSL